MKLFSGIVLLLILLCFAIGHRIFYKTFHFQDGQAGDPLGLTDASSEYDKRVADTRDWAKTVAFETLTVTARDGISLTGLYLPADGGDTTVIIFHGYHSEPLKGLGILSRYYHEKGYNVLLPYQRAHRPSGGKFMGFGLEERFDAAAWAEHIDRTYHPENIFLTGVSLGGATVCMAATLPLPETVRGILADCPYAEPWDELKYFLKKNYHLPAMFLYFADFWSVVYCHRHLNEFVKSDYYKATLPLWLVHGTDDITVPHAMSEDIAANYGGEVELWQVPGCRHGRAVIVAKEEYLQKIDAFIEKYKE